MCCSTSGRDIREHQPIDVTLHGEPADQRGRVCPEKRSAGGSRWIERGAVEDQSLRLRPIAPDPLGVSLFADAGLLARHRQASHASGRRSLDQNWIKIDPGKFRSRKVQRPAQWRHSISAHV
jgi:hypothetical protein